MIRFRAIGAHLLALTLFAVSLAPSAASAAPLQNGDGKLYPVLKWVADDEPLRVSRVIVQKARKDAHASDIVAGLAGARVVEEFAVIPAFVAEVPHGLLLTLASRPAVRYVSPDGPVEVVPQLPSGKASDASRPKAPPKIDEHHTTVSANSLVTTYPLTVGAPAAWTGAASHDGRHLTGAGDSAVAVIDSGIDANHPDLAGRVVAVNVNRKATSPGDGYGHGTHVAGIIGGNSAADDYLGIAPNTTLVSVKVTDDNGAAFESDLLRGLDWVNANRDAYHIRVANLSATTSLPQSYMTSPIDAAVEFLYHQNVTVVASAGNLGSAQDAVWYAPANDPLAITVGCLDDNLTAGPADDSLCAISSRGVTQDGFAKPDVVAPGRKIVSALASGLNGRDALVAQQFPERVTADGRHIRLSGTSMAAPVVTGAIALLLERQSGLTPDQVRQILVGTANRYPGQVDAAGLLDIPGAVVSAEHPPAHTDSGPLPVGGARRPQGARTLLWDGSHWATMYAGFDSAKWDTAHWDTAHWDTAHWDTAHWDAAHWDAAHWDAAHWDAAHWDAAHWDAAHWDAAHWDAAHWDAAHWDGSRWTAARYD
jgi:serine protease AprX